MPFTGLIRCSQSSQTEYGSLQSYWIIWNM